MKLSIIEDVAEPVVGRYYLVPCVPVYAAKAKAEAIRDGLLPVIGPWHEDKDIGVSDHHFHYDCRFVPERIYTETSRYIGKIHTSKMTTGFWPADSGTVPAVVYKRRKMLRVMPEFPDVSFLRKLEADFADVTLKCKTCPHRGMSLQGLPVRADGTVVCNGHGLVWNLNTGRMVPRSRGIADCRLPIADLISANPQSAIRNPQSS